MGAIARHRATTAGGQLAVWIELQPAEVAADQAAWFRIEQGLGVDLRMHGLYSRHPQGAQDDADEPAHQEGEGEDEEGHAEGDFPAAFFDGNHELSQAGDE